jgi:uridine phosphorylase
MHKQGIEVKRKTNLGIILETPYWLSVIEKLYPDSKRVFYNHSQDEVLHIKFKGLDIAFIADRGSSISACITERLLVYGAKAIARIGTCGGLSDQVKLLRPIITTACYSDEGTSKHYLPLGFPIISDINLNFLIADAFKKSKIDYQFGITITTDGRWREDPSLLKELNKLGILSIEMDTAAIFSVCQFRGVPVAAIYIPADLPVKENNNSNSLKGVPARKDHIKKLEAIFVLILPMVLNALADYYTKELNNK